MSHNVTGFCLFLTFQMAARVNPTSAVLVDDVVEHLLIAFLVSKQHAPLRLCDSKDPKLKDSDEVIRSLCGQQRSRALLQAGRGRGRLVVGPQLVRGSLSALFTCRKWYRWLKAALAESIDGLPPLVEVPRQLLAVTASASVSGGGTGGEFPENLLLDGAEGWNKWYATHGLPFRLTFDSHVEIPNVAGYAIRIANDTPARDPHAWKLLDQNGRVLHEVTEEEATARPRARAEWCVFRLPEPASASKLELCITKTGNRECQLHQVAFFTTPEWTG